jgi:hypothetical protein
MKRKKVQNKVFLKKMAFPHMYPQASPENLWTLHVFVISLEIILG